MAINWHGDPTFSQPSSLSVKLHLWPVLNAAKVEPLNAPNLLHAESIQQRDVQGASSCRATEGVQKVLKEECQVEQPASFRTLQCVS